MIKTLAIRTHSVFFSVLIILLITTGRTLAGVSANNTVSDFVKLNQSDNSKISLGVEVPRAVFDQVGTTFDSDNESPFPGIGALIEEGKPTLPMVSRFVIVPPFAGLRLNCEVTSSSIADLPENLSGHSFTGVYPPVAAEMSQPFIIRGVRMVRVVTYPVQIDGISGKMISNNVVNTEIEFTDDVPVNPVQTGVRRHLSSQFRKFIEGLAINSEVLGFDDNDEVPLNNGHYLIVANENCVHDMAPFIEWRRKAGFRVDILAVPQDIAHNDPNQIKALIQARYNAFIESGEEPFDEMLLVGDRSAYRDGPAPTPGWILAAPDGESNWPEPPHSDFQYACLEGQDIYPDVAFSRFCAGADSIIDLFVGRTLAYEANPYMEDTRWFTRGAVYSQHWGNQENNGAWHISLPANLRWAEQLLKTKGYTDLRLMEDYVHSQQGVRILPFERQLFADGSNLLLGRVEVLAWEWSEPNDDQRVFPLRLSLSGHGEYATWVLLRAGTGEHLKGPVVATCGWGGPPTTTTNAVWLELVNSMVNRDLDFGWSRNMAIIASENYFSNFYVPGQRESYRVYSMMKSDYDFYGDPGLQQWNGVPSVLAATFPQVIDTSPSSIEVVVTDRQGRVRIPGATVTLYAPGAIPAPESDEYVTYDDMQMWTMTSGADGAVRFTFPEAVQFVRGTNVYVTVTGRTIKPVFGTISVGNPESRVDIATTTLTETDGNNNGSLNPSETFSLAMTAVNNGQSDLQGVTARIASLSPDIALPESNDIRFGNIPAGARVAGESSVTILSSNSIPDASARPQTRPKLQVEFTDGNRTWTSYMSLEPVAPRIALSSINNGNVVELGASREIDMVLTNAGSAVINSFWVKFSSLGHGAIVENDSVTFPSLDPGESEWCNGTPLSVRGDPSAIPGSLVPMMFVITSTTRFVDTVFFNLQIGNPRANAPQSPDKYGYICYDDTDNGWVSRPTYNWIEINPTDEGAEFEGSRIAFNRQSEFDQGETIVLPLGFQSRFYGTYFDSVTIGTNGYLLPGNQGRVINPENWPLDRGIGGGVGMMAPFWDWLKFEQNSNIYYYSDRENGRFIVQWQRMRQRNANQGDLTFQVVIYDRARWARESGDPEVLFQYRQIENLANVDSSGEWQDVPYASVGISSTSGKTGSSYTFRNTYPVTSAPLAANRAIRYTTSPLLHNGVVYGVVRDLVTSNPVENATVKTGYGLEVLTDANGAYRIPRVVIGDRFRLISNGVGYADSVVTGILLANSGDSLNINFSLRHGQGVELEQPDLPLSSGIVSIYPNPFNGIATVDFSIARTGFVQLSAYDLSGRNVGDIYGGHLPVGSHSVEWNAGELPSGIYIVRMRGVDSGFSNAKVLLAR